MSKREIRLTRIQVEEEPSTKKGSMLKREIQLRKDLCSRDRFKGQRIRAEGRGSSIANNTKLFTSSIKKSSNLKKDARLYVHVMTGFKKQPARDLKRSLNSLYKRVTFSKTRTKIMLK